MVIKMEKEHDLNLNFRKTLERQKHKAMEHKDYYDGIDPAQLHRYLDDGKPRQKIQLTDKSTEELAGELGIDLSKQAEE